MILIFSKKIIAADERTRWFYISTIQATCYFCRYKCDYFKFFWQYYSTCLQSFSQLIFVIVWSANREFPSNLDDLARWWSYLFEDLHTASQSNSNYLKRHFLSIKFASLGLQKYPDTTCNHMAPRLSPKKNQARIKSIVVSRWCRLLQFFMPLQRFSIKSQNNRKLTLFLPSMNYLDEIDNPWTGTLYSSIWVTAGATEKISSKWINDLMFRFTKFQWISDSTFAVWRLSGLKSQVKFTTHREI